MYGRERFEFPSLYTVQLRSTVMKKISILLTVATLLTGAAAVTAPPSAAGVSIHVGNGGISFRDHHYYRGRGYYYHNNWYQHRSRWHGHWRYR